METKYIQNRLSLLRTAMQEIDIDALFCTDTTNVTYLSAFTGEESYLLLTGKNCGSKNLFITDSRYLDQAALECPEFEIVQYGNPLLSLPETLSMLCRSYGIKILGFEKMHIPYHLYESITTVCHGNPAFLPTEQMVERLRIIKDEAEISLLRHACACTDMVFAALCDYIRPGLTEKDIEWRMYTLFHELDCDSSFQPIIASGIRGALPHGAASEKKLSKGEFLTLDFGCQYKGYHADMTRTVHIGPANPEAQKIYQIVLEANQKAEAALCAGICGKLPDDIARSFIAEQGYGANFGHSLGHGVGLDIHERPTLSPRSKDILQPDTFVTVEPGIYLSKWGGIRIEDTVRVTAQGIENMFTSTKELICL